MGAASGCLTAAIMMLCDCWKSWIRQPLGGNPAHQQATLGLLPDPILTYLQKDILLIGLFEWRFILRRHISAVMSGTMRARLARLGGSVDEEAEDRDTITDITDVIPTSRQSSIKEKGSFKQKDSSRRDRVKLCVSGAMFVTFSNTLHTIPDTRLAELSPDEKEYDKDTDSYFFDRNAHIFTFILSAYQTGHLHLPHCLCSQSVKAELEYWRIPVDLLAACCWKKYCEFEEEVEALEALEDAMIREKTLQQKRKASCARSSLWTRISANIYLFLEEPKSSVQAKVWSWTYIALLLGSVGLMALSTVESCRVPVTRNHQMPFSLNDTKAAIYWNTREHPALRICSTVISCIFMAELTLRFVVWPGKRRFFRCFFNIIDAISVIPIFIIYLTSIIDHDFWMLSSQGMYISFVVLGFANIFRTLRILKLMRHNRDLRVMTLAIKASAREMMLLLFVMAIGTLIFSTSIYYAEFRRDDSFLNIPQGFWWSIITMTTVGYGDITPSSSWGYVIGACCALSGMVITALPIPIIANNFNLYYSFAKMDENMAKRMGENSQMKQPKIDGLLKSIKSAHK